MSITFRQVFELPFQMRMVLSLELLAKMLAEALKSLRQKMMSVWPGRVPIKVSVFKFQISIKSFDDSSKWFLDNYVTQVQIPSVSIVSIFSTDFVCTSVL